MKRLARSLGRKGRGSKRLGEPLSDQVPTETAPDELWVSAKYHLFFGSLLKPNKSVPGFQGSSPGALWDIGLRWWFFFL